MGERPTRCFPCRLKEFVKEQLVNIPAPRGPASGTAPTPAKAPFIPPDDPGAILAGLLLYTGRSPIFNDLLDTGVSIYGRSAHPLGLSG